MAPRTLYILYNANGSVMGKVAYAYRHITCSKSDDPACAACEITHGGLHLNETEEWRRAKASLVERDPGLKIEQLHRDQIDHEMKKWVEEKKVKYPMVLLRGEGAAGFEVVMDSAELAESKGDPGAFVAKLTEKNAFKSEI